MTRSVWTAVAVLALGGCSPNPKGNPDSGVDCSHSPIAPGSQTLVQAYASNTVAISSDGSVQIVLIQSNPAPPISDSNTWQLQIKDGSGNALPSAVLSIPSTCGNVLCTGSEPCMPFHGHCSDQSPTLTPGSNGQWTVSDLYFFMDGVWHVPFQVTQGSSVQNVDFYFCIDG